MVSVPLGHLAPLRPEPLAHWPVLGDECLIPSRSRAVCLTCHFFRHHPGPDGIPLLTCQLHQGLITHGEHLTRRCHGWTEAMHRRWGWAPEAS